MTSIIQPEIGTRIRELRVRVTRTQYERVRNTSESKGKSISQYIRNLIFENDMNVVFKILEIHNIAKRIDSNTNLIRENLEQEYGKKWKKSNLLIRETFDGVALPDKKL